MEDALEPLHKQESTHANLTLYETFEGSMEPFWKDILAESNNGKQSSDPLLFSNDFPPMNHNSEARESLVAPKPKAKKAKTSTSSKMKARAHESPVAPKPKAKGAKTPTSSKMKARAHESPVAPKPKAKGAKTPTSSKMKKCGSGPNTQSFSNEMWFQWFLSKINRVEEHLTARESTIENLSFNVTELQKKNEFELLLLKINHLEESNASTVKALESLTMQFKALEVQTQMVVENMIDMASQWKVLTQNSFQSKPPPARVPMFRNALDLLAHYRPP